MPRASGMAALVLLAAPGCAPIAPTVAATPLATVAPAADRHDEVRGATGLPSTGARVLDPDELALARDQLNAEWDHTAPLVTDVAHDPERDQVVAVFGPGAGLLADTREELHRRYVTAARLLTDRFATDGVVLHPPRTAFAMPGLALVYFAEDVHAWPTAGDAEALWREGVLLRIADGRRLFDGSSRGAEAAPSDDVPAEVDRLPAMGWAVAALGTGDAPPRLGLLLPDTAELATTPATTFSLLASTRLGPDAGWHAAAGDVLLVVTVRPGSPDRTGELIDVSDASTATTTDEATSVSGQPALRSRVHVPGPGGAVAVDVLSVRTPALVVSVAAGCAARCLGANRPLVDAILDSVVIDQEVAP